MTIPRSAGWLGCDAECDPNLHDRGGQQDHARTRGRRGGRSVGSDETAAACATRASVGLSPAAGAGPVPVGAGCDPLDDGDVMGRHRSDPRSSGVGHDAAGAARRVDRGGGVRPLRVEAFAAFDRIIGLDLTEVTLDGSLHKAPCGGEGTGANPTDRGKCGWKWSVAVDRHGVPVGWAIDGANRNDVRMLNPTLDDIAAAGLLIDIDTIHLDRGYDSGAVRGRLAGYGLTNVNIQRRKGAGRKKPTASARTALDRRSRQHLVVELRTAAPQHRPPAITATPPSASPPS